MRKKKIALNLSKDQQDILLYLVGAGDILQAEVLRGMFEESEKVEWVRRKLANDPAFLPVFDRAVAAGKKKNSLR